MSEHEEKSPPVKQAHNYTNLKLDDATILTLSEQYQEEVREPVQWLAAFLREKCNRNFHVLESKVRKLGFNSDASYFHRIFSGKYFLVDGRKVGSIHNFVQIVDALRAEDRIAWRAGRITFVETTTWDMIENFITVKRAPERVNKFGGIVGATGTQKTACFKEYCIRNNHGACSHLEAPERPNMTQFVTDLAVHFGVPRGTAREKKTNAIISALNEKKTIIVDNVQRLYRPRDGGDQPIFNFLQKVQDETGCTVIMSFTPDFTRILSDGVDRGYFEQFVGRMGGLKKILRLPDKAPREDVRRIAKSFGLAQADKHIQYLEAIAARNEGRIRVFFETLQDAKLLAEAEGRDLTIDLVRLAAGEEMKEAA